MSTAISHSPSPSLGITLTPELVQEQRLRLVACARTWLFTPFHHRAAIKGHGADCRGFIQGAAFEAGLLPEMKVYKYSPQQNLHRNQETYLKGLLEYCDEVPGPLERTPKPGDVIIWKFQLVFFHTAIVTEWPLVIHAHQACGGVDYIDVSQEAWLNTISETTPDRGKPRPRKVLVFKPWMSAEETSNG